MKSTWKAGQVSGIDLHLHWTFLLMLGGLFFFYLYVGASLMGALAGVGMMIFAFGCVTAHELGHALMAKRYGIPTLDITLYPIGGVARLQRMPKKPNQEIWIAIAGPAVNVAIGMLLYVIISTFGSNGVMTLSETLNAPMMILNALMWFNFVMAGFNMLPAFPLDGGRVLRAGLATKMGYSRATQIAAVTGQAMAVLMLIYSVTSGQYMLIFIALFIIFAAQQEARYAFENDR